MGEAVIRTVVDPESGETIDLMGVMQRGKLTFQRLAPPPETPRALENYAAFGETASRAYGQRKTGRLPPAAETVKRIARFLPPATPDNSTREREKEEKQRRYRALLGEQVPDIEEELILRRLVSMPLRTGPTPTGLANAERRVRDLVLLSRTPYHR